MAISKIILNNVTQMDVTQDSVTAGTLLSGETATQANGVRTTGTYTAPVSDVQVDSTSIVSNGVANIIGMIKNTGVTITSSNKSNYFTDADNAPDNTVYKIELGAEIANTPYGYGISSEAGVYTGTVRSVMGYVDGLLYTFVISGMKQQFFLTSRTASTQILWFRVKYSSGSSWTDWRMASNTATTSGSNFAIRKKFIAPYLDANNEPTATDTGTPNPQYINDPFVFNDFDNAPRNSIYQIDLDCDATVMANNPAPGKSSVLITTNFAYNSSHAEVQTCIGLTTAGGDAFMYWRYGYIASGNVYTFTPWQQVNPMASSSVLGCVKIDTLKGIDIDSNGVIRAYCSGDDQIKEGTEAYRPIAPKRQEKAVFYGLAKAAGNTDQASSSNAVGTYTEDALSKISDMLNAPVYVSGSTPSITAKAGVRYVCGECSTLSVTVPITGCIDVLFSSGSTPTVLTVTNPNNLTIQWANGFSPSNLEANTVYEINILEGLLGVGCAWT